MTEPNPDKKLLGALLSGEGLITEEQMHSALAAQKKHGGGRLGYWLVRLGFLSAEMLARFLTANQNIGRIQESSSVRQTAAAVVPRSLAHHYKIAPIRLETDRLTIALSEVSNAHLVELLSEVTGYKIDALMVSHEEVAYLIESSYPLPAEEGIEISAVDDNTFAVIDIKKEIKPLMSSQWQSGTTGGERLRSVIAEAIKEKFREILLLPDPEQTEVYFKKDILKQSDFTLSPSQHEDLSYLLFSLARMNPLLQNTPQHGRFVVKINERKVLMVVSAIPTMYGVRFLMEMYDERILKHNYEENLKPFPEVRKDVEDFLTAGGKGMLIITGPEGSGRTRFLYSVLCKSKENFRNIHTLETLIRYPVHGIRQNEVTEEQMEAALDQYLYQAPDLVALSVVKGVRPVDTAFLLAARTPVVMVLSSYDAFKAVEWLAAHNLKSPIKAGLLHAVISPRIMPGLCPRCSVPIDGRVEPFDAMQIPAGLQLKMNQGCEVCRSKENLRSQILFESFRIDEQAIEWILHDHSSEYLRRSARAAGRNTLYDLAIRDAISDNLDMLSVAKLQ